MATIIMAGVDITAVGWDEVCRMSAKAAREGKAELALALVQLNIHNAVGGKES